MVDWAHIDQKYPSKLNKSEMKIDEWRKQRTLELYSYLPQTTLEERRQYTDIRDAVIELNYLFFGYIASHKFINNPSVDYEDKFQSAAFHFTEMWEKFQYAPKYRTDLSFAVFFKPRITECMERELDQVKYSLRRTLCMEVGDIIGKHWAKVTYEDLELKEVAERIPADKMESLKAIFGSLYAADLETHAMFIESAQELPDDIIYYSDNYDSLTDMLIHEMVVRESDLSDNDILDLAMMLDIPYQKLKDLYPTAKEKLHEYLIQRLDIRDTF